MNRRWICLVLILNFAIIIGCDNQNSNNEQLSQLQVFNDCDCGRSFSGPDSGGRIVLGLLGEPTNLIPPLATDSSSHEIADLIYVAPLKYDKDIQLVPWAAEKISILKDGTVLRFTLKRGIRWFDGHELTASDVQFTYRFMIDPNTPTAYAEDYNNIHNFNLIDRYTFEVTYKKPFARSLVTWAHAILPRHILEKESVLNTKYSRSPVGAGPYKLRQWESGRQIILESNADYFEGKPFIDQVVYRIIPDTSTMFLELKSRQLDMMGLTPQQFLYQAKGKQWDCDYHKYRYLSFGYTYLGYNLRHPLFRSKRIRQALSHAISKQELVKGVLLGLGQPAIGPYKPGTWPYNEHLQDYLFDPEKARQILMEEGWIDHDGDGVIDKNGKPFSFTVLTNQGNDLRIKAATIIQERLKAVGIRVQVRTLEWATFVNEFIKKKNFDAALLGWNILQDPDIYDVWHSSKMDDGLNFVSYSNPEVDTLLEQGRQTLDARERKSIYNRFQAILHEDQPYCFLWVPLSLPIVHCRYQGLEAAPAGITHNFTQWWIPKDRQKAQIQP